ncbi:MAG: HD domain-containing protein, partial [Patescibacteria group bacterium]
MEFSSFLKAAKAYLPKLNEKRLNRAYHFAALAHQGQKRKDGSDYITHPLAAASLLNKLRVDEDTLIACLLHDVPEETAFTLEDVEKRFGKKVAFLVQGITKLSKVHYRHNMEERQIESLKKLFIHS